MGLRSDDDRSGLITGTRTRRQARTRSGTRRSGAGDDGLRCVFIVFVVMMMVMAADAGDAQCNSDEQGEGFTHSHVSLVGVVVMDWRG